MLEIQDAIYQAGSIAAKSEIQKCEFDATKECVVIDDTNWENNEYLVRLGTTPFAAYSTDSSEHYLPNEIVYVHIPKSDMSLQKFIIGRKVDEEDENVLFHYQFPFDDFVALKQLIEPSPEQHGFLANKNKIYENDTGTSDYISMYHTLLSLESDGQLTLDDLNLTSDLNYSEDNEVKIAAWVNSADNPGPTIGDRLGLTVNVQTLLDYQRPINGTFGLRVHVSGLLKSTDENSKVTYDERDYYFTNKDMYGNPYAFTMPKEQQIIFDVSDFMRIEKVEVFFQQDFLFFNQYNEYITWKRTNGILDPNIIFNNLGVYLGFKASELGKDQIFLYTYDETTYGDNPDSLVDRNVLDQKTIYVAYVHYDQTSKTYKLYDSQEEFDEAGYEIFWYIKDNNWYLDAANSAYDETKTEHRYGGLYWAPMSKENSTLPVPIDSQRSPIYDRVSYTFVPDINRSVYRLKAAVRSDSTHIVSDILVFQNKKDVETELQDLARNDKIIIRIGTPMTAVDRDSTIIYQSGDFTNFFVYDENNNALISDDKRTYTKDDVVYKFPDQIRYSDIPWYAEIWVKEDVFKDTAAEATADSTDGYVRLSDYCYAFDKDPITGLPIEKYVPFDVEWSTVEDPSMIENFRPLDNNSKETYPYYVTRSQQQVHFDYSAFGEKHIETKTDVDELTTRMFNIAPTYDINANRNTISATIRRNGQEFTAKVELLFGRAGAQGCPYTPVIRINQPAGNTHIIADSPFILQCVIQDNYGKVYEGGFSCEWTFLGNQPSVTYSSYIPESGLSGINSIVTGTVHDTGDCKPFSVICKVAKVDGDGAIPIDYDIYGTRGMLVGSSNAALWLASHAVSAVSRVEFDADGQAPHYASQMFKVIGPPHTTTETQWNILNKAGTFMRTYIDTHDPSDTTTTMADYVRTAFSNDSGSPSDAVTQLESVVGISLDEMTLADIRQITEKDYIYPSWHLNAPIQLKDVIRLYDEPLYASVPKLVHQTDTYDAMKYYQIYDAEKNCYYAVNYNDALNTRNFNTDKQSGLLFYRDCVEYATFYNGTQTQMPNVAQYYLKYGKNADAEGAEENNSTDEDSTFWQWKDEYLEDKYFTWLTFQYHDSKNNKDITISQGIVYFRYLYSSSLVDQWDGSSLSLDAETSTIIAQRIAAGTKNSRNQFTGVMMGAYSGYTSNQLMRNKTGIYGFQDGAISFGFLEDGTGFIGPSGAGRIQFDGRNALISNSTKSCYLNLNPSQLTYGQETTAQNADWYDSSNAGISSYFLYCKVPVDIYRTLTSNRRDYADTELEWTTPFLEDSSNNYFVVDPNRGTIISAGIAARYGRIGNWFINDTGLYQQYINPDDASKSRFMYLGMPTYNEIIPERFQDQLGSWKTGFNSYKSEHSSDTNFSRLTDVEILGRYYQEKRQHLIDGTAEEWQPASLEERVKTLGKYLNYSEFGMDVYHFYTFGTAARNVAAFLRRKISTYYGYPYDWQTPEKLWNLIYDDGGQAMIDITYTSGLDDWSTDGPLSNRNIETYLHNHYIKVQSGSQTVSYTGKNGNSVSHTFTAGQTYRLTQYYGYLTPMSALLNGYSASGYSSWDPEVTPSGTYAVDGNGNYPGSDYYVDYQDIYWYNQPGSDKAAYIRINDIGDVAPRLRGLPSITTTQGSETATAIFYANSYISTSDVPLVQVPNYVTISGSNMRLTNSGLQRGRGTVDVDWLVGYCNALDKIYEYYRKCFNKQLAQMLESGLEILETKDPEAYEEASAVLEMMGGLEVIEEGGLDVLDEGVTFTDGLTLEAQQKAAAERKKAEENEKQAKIAALDKEFGEILDKINKCADPNRYAIYTGYESPLTCYADEAPNPFFSVRWNGYMTARHGKIGYDSPWYISDAGLTQKNNSGIIFLGDPEQDGSAVVQTNSVGGHNGTKALFTDEFGNSLSAQLLPNGSKLSNQVAYVVGSGATGGIAIAKHYAEWSTAVVQDQNENYPYESGSSIALSSGTYSGSDLQYLGPEAFGTYGNFAIYAGTEFDGINFGVRMDGTVFCKRLQAQNIKIVGGDVDGATLTNNEDRFGWPAPGEPGSNVSYRVRNPIIITNFYNQNQAGGTTTYEKLAHNVEAGGDVHVYQGGLSETRDANGALTALTITNCVEATRVTIVDAAGTRYYTYDTTTQKWSMLTTGFMSYTMLSQVSDPALIANYIAEKDAILLGGNLDGWVYGPSSIYIRRNGVIGSSGWVYSIHLDGANNQITLANSQIVLDGTNGVIFIGRPEVNNDEVMMCTTDSHLVMSNINITAHTVGVTQYSSEIIGGSSIVELVTTATTYGSQNYTWDGSGSAAEIIYEEVLDLSGNPHDLGYYERSNGVYIITTDTEAVAGKKYYQAIAGSNVIHGQSSVWQITAPEFVEATAQSITYDAGFYTICYDQSELLDVPRINSNSQPIVDGHGGVGIAFTNTSNNYGQYPIAFYPFAYNSQLGIDVKIGNDITKYRWNILATVITADTGIYIEDAEGNRDPVVTYSQFKLAIDKINASIEELTSSVDQNAKDTAEAIRLARQALAKANESIKQSIVSMSWAVDAGQTTGTGTTSLKLQYTRVSGATEQTTNTVLLATGNHSHSSYIKVQDGSVSISVGTVNAAGGGGYDQSTGTVIPSTGGDSAGGNIWNGSWTVTSSDGTITAKTTIAGKEGTLTFNIADTTYYKQHAYGSYSIGTYNTTGKTYPLTITAIDGSTKLVDAADISAQDAYNAGWADAIAHAKAKAKINGATAKLTGSATVTGNNGAYRHYKRTDGTYADAVYCYTSYTLNDTHAAAIDTQATINWSDVKTAP